MPSPTLASTPGADGFSMPAEWEPHESCYLIWPERTDNWRLGAKPAQTAFVRVAEAIARSEPVTMLVSAAAVGTCPFVLLGRDQGGGDHHR